MTRIVILGGGTGGTLTAHRLRRELDDGAEIVVVDRDDRHVYQPGLLFVPFGLAAPDGLVRSRSAQLHGGIELCSAEVDRVETASNEVHLADGSALSYNVLVVASGARLAAEETEGLTGLGWRERVSDFYTLDGATALRDALARFNGGRLVEAGSVTHFEGETLVANIRHHLAGEPLDSTFDGHANCFIETGFHKALLIDFNYDVEPLPGRYPEPHLGPLPLLKQSRLNHMGKLMFQWIYRHVLLPGHEIPGVGSQLHTPEGAQR